MEGFSDTETRLPYDRDHAQAPLSLEAATQFVEELPYPALWIDRTCSIRWRNRAAVETYGEHSGACYKAIHGFDAPCPEYGDRCPMVDRTPGLSPTLRHIHRTVHGPAFFLVVPLPVRSEGILVVHLPIEDTLIRDSITHLYTRSAFEQLATMQIQLLSRLEQRYSVVLADVDRLKSINDQFGHAAGDAAIATVARTLSSSVRASDTAGRWGGDEFCVLLPSAGRRDAERLVDRIRSSLASVQVPGYPALDLQVSFGIASSRERYDLHQSVRRADRALYRAKQKGRR